IAYALATPAAVDCPSGLRKTIWATRYAWKNPYPIWLISRQAKSRAKSVEAWAARARARLPERGLLSRAFGWLSSGVGLNVRHVEEPRPVGPHRGPVALDELLDHLP